MLIFTKIYHFKEKPSEIKDKALCLGNISNNFTINKKAELKGLIKAGLKGVNFFFSVDFSPIDTNDALDIHKFLINRTWYKREFGLIKKILIGFFADIVSAYNHKNCALLSNQKCMIHHTLINMHSKEFRHEFRHYSFAVKLDRFVGSCNVLNDLSNKVCVSNKTVEFNLSVFNMITGINESKTITKHILCECKCRFDGRNCNSNQ